MSAENSPLLGAKPVSPYQAAALRIILGLFFGWQGLELIRAGDGLVPGWLSALLPVPAILLAWGCLRRTSALLLWLGFAWLYSMQPLLEPVAAALTGTLLLFQVFLPTGEGLQWKRMKADPSWRFPAALFWGGWVLLAVYYGWNAVLKFQSPSWTEGVALKEILQSILVEECWFRKVLLGLPDGMLRMLTYVLLGAELIFPLLCWVGKARPWIWILMLLVQGFWLLLLNDGMGSLGLILFQFWIFDPDWLPARKAEDGKSLVLYDGVCGLCNGTVQFLLGEDHGKILRFAALQGATAEKVLGSGSKGDLASIVYVRDWQTDGARKFTRSEAVLQILADLGGFWRVVSWLRLIPSALRDAVYRIVAKRRYRMFGKYESCPVPGPGVRERFLD